VHAILAVARFSGGRFGGRLFFGRAISAAGLRGIFAFCAILATFRGYDTRIRSFRQLLKKEALMKFASQVYTNVSGSVGGLVYSHNKGGMYTRGRAIPVNPATDTQIMARSALSMAAADWNATSEANRQLWRDYAESQSHVDKIGNVILWSGQQEFIAANSSLMAVGESPVVVPPLVLTKPEFDVSDLAIDDTQAATVTTNALPVLANSNILASYSRPVSPGVNFFKGPFQRSAIPIDVSAGGTGFAGPSTFPAEAGQIVWGCFVLVLADGRYTRKIIRSAVVTV